MIKIDSFIFNKGSNSSSSNGGGGFANTITVQKKIEKHKLWGQEFDGTQDVDGDMTVNGNVNASGNVTATNGNITNVNSTTINNNGNIVNGGNITNTGNLKTANVNIDDDLTVGNNANVGTINATNGNITTVNSSNITNADTIKTKNLQVTGTAHFFNLIIDKIKSAGGAALFTPADGFDIDIVQDSTDEVKLLWQCQDEDGNQRDNMWKVNDQALCMSFNKAKVGTSHSVSNKYYWALVTGVNKIDEPLLLDGVKYNYISLSKTVVDGVLNPEFGDSIVMCGYRGTDDAARQSAIYISSYFSLDKGLTAPLLAQYQGINDFNLESHRNSYYDAVSAKFIGEFEVSNGQNIEDFINDKIKVVDDKYSSLNVAIDGINTKVVNNTTKIIKLGENLKTANNNITALETTVSNNYSTLDQKADGINAKVLENTTTINNINGQVTENKTNIANLTVKADGIESTVSSMSNGTGTNLFSFTNANFRDYNCMSSIQMNGFFTLGLNQSLYRVMNLGCNGVTGDYVVSFDARVLNDDGTGTVVNVNFCDEWAIENNSDIKVYNWFKHYVLHFINIQSSYLRKDLYDGFIDFEPKVKDANNQLYVANFMLERGNIPSTNFSLSEADRNNFKSNNVFTSWYKAATVDIVDVSDLHNSTTTKAYKQEGLPKDTGYIDTLVVHDFEKKFKIEPYKVYTLSFWAKSLKGNHRISCYLYPNISNAGLQNILYKDINGAGTQTAYTASGDGYTSCELDTTWRKFYIHWQPHQIGSKYECICGRLSEDKDENGDKVTVYIAEPKLEEGYICDENISNQDTYSSIKQTANEILAQVNKTYVKIGDGNITLNGDTKVNGSLTLNDDKQGFLLLGNGGTTEISPKSIGSYTAFKDKTSNVIRTHYHNSVLGALNIGTNNYAFFWSVTQKLGTYKKGDYIKLTNYTNNVVTSVGTNIGTPYAKFYINENGTQTKAIDLGVKNNVDIDNYTVVNDNADIQVTAQFTIYAPKSIWNQARGIDTDLPNTPSITTTVEWDNEVPNKNAFMLIGYDGWGVNFGSNKTVYCGAEGFIASFGDSLFKITSDGIVEKKNGANVAIVTGSSSRYSPSYYQLQEGVDTILCKSGYTVITLPSKPYQGQSVKIFDKSPQEVYVNFNGYMVGANSDYNSRTHQTKYPLDGTVVRTFTYIGDTWFMEYMG